ncbi:hypothetical protein [Tropicibacter sp. S64]|uniref:hypothetical protein n=1 Tax=Tropicibacter sp. S64 TaxID=3415122 RepID=UPI003C7AFD5C
MRQILAAMALVATSAVPAAAEMDIAAAKSCLIDAQTKRGDPSVCIDAAHADCLAAPGDTPSVAALCFATARDDWGTGIRAEMDRIKAEAPEDIATVTAIDLKYDLILALTQCDRMEELAGIGGTPAAVIEREKARCMASASGFAYARLLWRSATMPEQAPKEN